MSTPAGWFDDPTKPGRLRYWDGGSWTEWVSVDGQTVSEPIGTAVPAASGQPTGSGPIPEAGRQDVQPTPGIRSAPAAGGWGGFGEATGPAAKDDYPVQPLGRIGLGLIVIAGILTAVSTNQEATRAANQPFERGYDTDPTVIVLGAIMAVVAAAAIVIKPYWSRIVAIAVSTGILSFFAFFLIGSRTGDAFLSGDDLELKSGWWLIAAGVIVGFIGVLLAVLGVVQARRTQASDGGPSSSSKGTVALVLSLIGIIVTPLAPAGAAMGFLAKRDAAASGGRIGTGTATAGIVIGLIVLVLAAGGLLIGAFVATP
jgi:uncharacterized membrane protein